MNVCSAENCFVSRKKRNQIICCQKKKKPKTTTSSPLNKNHSPVHKGNRFSRHPVFSAVLFAILVIYANLLLLQLPTCHKLYFHEFWGGRKNLREPVETSWNNSIDTVSATDGETLASDAHCQILHNSQFEMTRNARGRQKTELRYCDYNETSRWLWN